MYIIAKYLLGDCHIPTSLCFGKDLHETRKEMKTHIQLKHVVHIPVR